MIIGLTGENCSGKGVVADYLQKKSFYFYSLSDVIREELASKGTEITRDALIKAGNDLRQKYGPSVLAVKTAAKLQADKNYVIDSIRNPAEVEELKKLTRFVLLKVMASPENRFERMKERKREGDPETLDEFLRIEKLEASNHDGAKQQVTACMKLADKTIVNDDQPEILYKKADQLLQELQGETKKKRPDWDEYFMNIAKVVALRSNCMKRHVAAVIVKDKRIISTGYNGTPRGVTNCSEGGCPRCNQFAEGGTRLDECLCSHGEENAIVQASYHGISIKDASLYTTFAPCLMCTKMIINAGIKEVVYNIDYPLNDTALNLYKEVDIKLRQFKVE
ncbi:MAG TPA: deaminase [Nitrospinota bacterium]|jgi:dCMP deaminase|nr:deaminase [Nitrospinota bacterium]